MTLKTLKNLRWLDWTEEGFDDSLRKVPLEHPKNTDCIYINDLREEAIKWVKELKKDEKYRPDNEPSDGLEAIDWIMHFFNLNEDDLEG